MNLWQDLRYAVRMLVKDRWFTLAAATALALGIGANATVFTLVNAVLIRGLPFDHPEQIMVLQTRAQRGQAGRLLRGLQGLARPVPFVFASHARLGTTVNVSDNDHVPERYQGDYISWNFFRMIGQTAHPWPRL